MNEIVTTEIEMPTRAGKPPRLDLGNPDLETTMPHMTDLEYVHKHSALHQAYLDGKITWDELRRAVDELDRAFGITPLSET